MKNRGYTLIELIVSVAIFSLVMLFVTTAYLSLIAATRHARATSTLMTNLTTSMDYMARSIRTGTNYQCGLSGGDCTGGTQFSFTDDQGHAVTYLLANGALAQCVDIGACNSATASSLTDPALTITSLQFFVRGTGRYIEDGDRVQPFVVLSVQGTISIQGQAPTTFSIETAATDRLIDVGS